MSELQATVERLVARHGGLRKAARALNIDEGYLSNMRHGKRDNPNAQIMRKLGLKRHVIFTAAARKGA